MLIIRIFERHGWSDYRYGGFCADIVDLRPPSSVSESCEFRWLRIIDKWLPPAFGWRP
jgi:hypothetical protein